MTTLDTTAPPSARGDLVDSLHAIYQELMSCPDLSPGPRVNDLFNQLVSLVLNGSGEHAERLLDDPAISALAPRLRELCGRGEAELELAWASRIAECPRPHRELSLFPYLDNYRLLSSMETTVLSDATDRPIRSVAFAGSGPMPLSSSFLTRDLGAPVDNFDRDARAVAVSERMSNVLGWHDLRFHHADIGTVELSGYDVVVLAALVGSTTAEKAAVLQHMARSMAPGALLLIRSARGLRTLLYPEVSRDSLGGFDVLTMVHPVNEVINSVIVARAGGSAGSAHVPAPRADRGM